MVHITCEKCNVLAQVVSFHRFLTVKSGHLNPEHFITNRVDSVSTLTADVTSIGVEMFAI